MKNIHTRLRKGFVLDPDINRGGCGFFALYVIRCLKRKGMQYKIMACNQSVDRHNDKKCVPSHILIEVNNKTYDSDGRFSSTCYPYKKYISEYRLNALIRQSDWNADFNRSKCNLVEINKTIKSLL